MQESLGKGRVYEVRRGALSRGRVVEEALAPAGEGELLMAIDCFALTANNVTYAVAGDAIGYWRFFPPRAADRQTWGRIPVWGFANVLDSGIPGIAPGERYYGYYPMGSHLRLRPGQVSERGFVDGSAHRAELPSVYNRYQRCAGDPAYRPGLEAMQLLFRPLFTTGFFLDDFLADEDFFGAELVLLSSASSKTAFGLAWLLQRRRAQRRRVIGLTSPGNMAFVRSLGCYDEVLSYGALDSLPRHRAVFVDMAGNATLRRRVHWHFGDALRYSCSVGATHWQEAQPAGNASLPGPQPTWFFAPARAEKRQADWGAADLARRSAAAWEPFVADAARLITVRRERGARALSARYRALLENRAAPADGYVLSL